MLHIFKRIHEIFFIMGFNGDNGVKIFLLQQPGKLSKGKTTVAHREVFVGLTMIVMNMYLPEKGRHGINPVGKWFPGKHVEMAGVETKSAMRR